MSSIAQIYENSDVQDLPEEVTGLSLGCGDPVTLASLRPGETVLDLGSRGRLRLLPGRRAGGGDGPCNRGRHDSHHA